MRRNLSVCRIARHPQKLIRNRNRNIDILKIPVLNMLSDLNCEVNLPTDIYMPRPNNVSVKNISHTGRGFFFVYDKVDMEAFLCLELKNA